MRVECSHAKLVSVFIPQCACSLNNISFCQIQEDPGLVLCGGQSVSAGRGGDWSLSSHLWLVAGHLLPGESPRASINANCSTDPMFLLQSLFDASFKDRLASFRLAPGTSMFIHWLVGMVYVFYFASFILLLREVLRPGVLWFLRNLNDPDFNPIQEVGLLRAQSSLGEVSSCLLPLQMIHLPMFRHLRRFLASMVIFGSTVLLMLWLPVKVIKYTLPGFLPYNVLLSR